MTYKLARLAMARLAPLQINLGNFIAAASRSLQAATSLPGRRPFLHSLIFADALGLLTGLLGRDPIDAWPAPGALISSRLRDASTGGTPYLIWPLRFERLTIPADIATQGVLFTAG